MASRVDEPIISVELSRAVSRGSLYPLLPTLFTDIEMEEFHLLYEEKISQIENEQEEERNKLNFTSTLDRHIREFSDKGEILDRLRDSLSFPETKKFDEMCKDKLDFLANKINDSRFIKQ